MQMKLLILLLMGGVTAQAGSPTFTDTFPLGSCRFTPWGGNAYFPLQPGRQLYYSNAGCVAQGDCEDLEELWITTEHETRRVTLGTGKNRQVITTRILEERETENGELKEVSRNFLSTCGSARDVYYFGEEVDDYEDGEIVGHGGAWLAGRHGALPGILMPDSAFIIGSRYFQEVAPGVALDRAEHLGANLEVRVPAGSFKSCIKVRETSPLDSGESIKFYCAGVGLVIDDELELTAIYKVHDDDDQDD